ncbi:AzlD domain-containing protein [Dechloromonas hortensis]|uniref:AzlD domain-containing protein n=1 Tax=Dechloromonas hortensis TaxID=337779 RepID=UPI0012911890|nr:AzlD domain-containing protein [Dechloromonas hortensis]
MSTGGLLLTMAACGLVTFLIRFSFIAGGQRLPASPAFSLFLRYVPPAILGALIAPEIFPGGPVLVEIPGNPRWWATLVALAVAAATRSVLATIAAGMLALWGAQAWLA